MSALVPINNVSVNFEVIGEVVFADTLKISEVFEKQHRDVLKIIRALPDDEFKSLNFQPSTYLDAQMKPRPCYNLTRDGFSLLVMGFTGEKAYKWKIEFIKAFNIMEAELKRIAISRYVDEISSLNAVLIDKTKRHQREINGFKSQIIQHNKQIELLKAQSIIQKHKNNQEFEFLLSELQMAANKLNNATQTFINDVFVAINARI